MKIQKALAIAVFACVIPTAMPTVASAAESWTFAEDAVTLSISGKDCVDPFAEPTASGDRIYAPCVADLPDPLVAYDCTESGSCTKAALRSRMGKSFTKVKLSDGTSRAFYVSSNFQTCTNKVETGLLSADGLEISGAIATGLQQKVDLITVTDQSGRSMTNCKTEAWGVPDAVVTPDGRVRIYIVEESASAVASDTSQKKCTAVKKENLKRQDGSPVALVPPANEVIASYTSTDASGTTFVKDAGYRFVGGYVDPEILRAKNGDWVAIVSTGPGCEGQQYFVATSTDGLNWKIVSAALNKLSVYAGDPTGFEVSANKFRIYYWTSPYHMGTGPATGFTLRRGTLELKTVADATTSSGGGSTAGKSKSVTIQCVKGKVVKKVTGVAPKCPAGYKKKA